MNKSLKIIIGSMLSCSCLAATINYPWYFEPNGVEECIELKVLGKKALIDVLDTKIAFVSVLEDKEAFSESYAKFNRVLTEAEQMHGTAMAGLIAGDYAILSCEDGVKSWCDFRGKIGVAGLAPDVRIIGREWIPGGDLEEVIVDSVNSRTLKNGAGIKIRADESDAQEVKLILLNISGGSKGGDMTLWLDTVKRKAKDNPYFLIAAAVGNDGKRLAKGEGVYPAIIPTPKHGRDPIIRVGSLAKYEKGMKPKAYVNSNYGSEHVDIMAPGQSIPVLMPNGEGSVVNGTSEATALVSGAAALVASCNPSATGEEIRNYILEQADRYSHLEDKVKDGRVLNIYKIVSKYCSKSSKKGSVCDEEGNCKKEL